MTARKKSDSASKELGYMERRNPHITKAAGEFEAMKKRAAEGRTHPQPCTDTTCYWHHEQPSDG